MPKNPNQIIYKPKTHQCLVCLCAVGALMIYGIIAFEWTINNSALLQFVFESNKNNIWSKWSWIDSKKKKISLLDDRHRIAMATEIDVRTVWKKLLFCQLPLATRTTQFIITFKSECVIGFLLTWKMNYEQPVIN